MSLLNPSVSQINKYSFLVKDTTTAQTYASANVDLTTVTEASLVFKKAYLPDDESTYEFDISADWQYLLGDGITLNVVDFPDYLFDGFDHFPDWMYSVTINYTYNSREYSKTAIIGFRKNISGIVFQQLQQSDWVEQLKCGCGCTKYSTGYRKFDYLDSLEIASDNCLIAQYQEILMALYKLTGETHEYSS